MNDLTIHIDQAYHIYKPHGLLFIERKPNIKLIMKYYSLLCSKKSMEASLKSFVTDESYTFTLELTKHYIYAGSLSLSSVACGRYQILLDGHELGYITVSPYFSNMYMCTLLTHLIDPLLDAIEKKYLPYNWLHLTPIHRSGNSGSAYSLLSWRDEDIYLSPSQIKQLKGYNIMTDVVLNHLSSDSPVLVEPCNSFNNVNRKDLKPAIILDFHLQLLEYSILHNLEPTLSIKNFTTLKKQVVLQDYFLSKFTQIVQQIVENVRIYEFEVIGNAIVPEEFEDMTKFVEENWADIVILTGLRNSAKLDEKRVIYLLGKCDYHKLDSIKLCYNQFVMYRFELEKVSIVESILNSVKYQLFGQEKAPHWFIMRYFAPITDNFKYNNGQQFLHRFHDQLKACKGYQGFVSQNGYLIPELENDGVLMAACNGWVMGASRDFIHPKDRCYITRALISWGDSVKLNYLTNDKLRAMATKYVIRQAQLFAGLRIDNAHNTDYALLTEVIKEARKVNSSLLVMLEIFTGDDSNNAHVTQQCNGDVTLKEMIHYASCDAVAGLVNCASYRSYIAILNYYSEPSSFNLQVPCLLFDITHDNQPFGSKNSAHSVANYLTYAAIAAFSEGSGCATTFGSDQGISTHIEVQSKLQYSNRLDFNLFYAKNELLKLRYDLIDYEQCYAHSYGDHLTIERRSSDKDDYIVLIVMPRYGAYYQREIYCWFDGSFGEVLMCYTSEDMYAAEVDGFEMCNMVREYTAKYYIENSYNSFCFKSSMSSGSVIVIRKRDDSIARCKSLVETLIPEFKLEFAALPFIQRKQFLAMAEMEEVELTGKRLFDFNGLHPTICGFDGVKDCILTSDICGQVAYNLRNGNWLYDYMIERNRSLCVGLDSMDYIMAWIKRNVSMGQKPACTYYVFRQLDKAINQVLCEQLGTPSDVLPAQLYRAGLLLVSFRPYWQNVDVNKWLTPEFRDAFEPRSDSSESYSEMIDKYAKRQRYTIINWKKSRPSNPLYMISLAAGFPHFFVGMFRSWGRDIALSVTGLIRDRDSLRVMLVSTASLLRHGLLPNLQDSGRNPRYNCRDAVWFWMCNIVEYIDRFGTDILSATFKRLFLFDEEENYYYDEQNQQFLYNYNKLMEVNKMSKHQTILDAIRHVLQRHWDGIDFVEWTCIDNNMKDEGKHVVAYVDHETGLVYGGNEYNCHTWMDKMGGSQICGNRGIPSTSRCGAAVEINLCARRVLSFFKKYLQDDFVHQWAPKIEDNIDKFRVKNGGRVYLRDVISYPDARSNEQDMLLRPNYLIGLSFYEREFINKYSKEVTTCFDELLEPFSIGMKTLAPFEKRYHSWYNNDDVSDFETANGFSYHNGPEWVFVYGRGLICLKHLGEQKLLYRYLVNIRRHMDIHCYVGGDCRSLPELTQGNAVPCGGSCISQNWSIGSILQSILD